MMKFFNKKPSLIIQATLIAMSFGFSAGIIGQMVADIYINPLRDNYILSQLINNSVSTIPDLNRVQKFLGIEQDFEVNKSITKISPSLVGLYPSKTDSVKLTSQIYLPSDLIANGFILTVDGWIVSYGNKLPANFVVVHDGKVHKAEKVVTDVTTGVTFIKIAADNLPVPALGDSDDATLGQLQIALNALNQAAVTNIKSLDYFAVTTSADYVFSSEKYNKSFLVVNNSITADYLGSPLVNLAGEVIGIVSAVNEASGVATIIPINQYRGVMLDILRSGEITRPYLGLEYFDLSKAIGLDKNLTKGLDHGALLISKPLASSPASKVDIAANDIIVGVGGQTLDGVNGLAELIQQYHPGDKINLEIRRGDNTFSVEVTLGTIKK